MLGVKDNGEIIGIHPEKIEHIKKDFVTAINNAEKINPTCYLSLQEFTIDGKLILYVYVPESSQVHRCNHKFFDRNEDGDLDITNNSYLITNLVLRKHKEYSENKVYPHATMEDFNTNLIKMCRIMAVNRRKEHPWKNMSDMELLKSVQLWQHDVETGRSGFTLACVLLFGTDNVIRTVLPYYKTDAILRRVNLDRYDDRDIVQTNLIDSYERLMSFVNKWLPDPFYQDETTRRISLRDKIFREIISNTLIHREYLNPYPAKLIIEYSSLIIENGNKAHTHGIMTPANFSPFPKNPIIAGVFREIGWADELGSGVRNLFKYTKEYAGSDPQIIEEDVFKVTIPFNNPLILSMPHSVTPQVTPQAIENLLEFCIQPKTRAEMQGFLNLSDRKYFREFVLKPLIEQGRLQLTEPDKPTSPKQKYYRI